MRMILSSVLASLLLYMNLHAQKITINASDKQQQINMIGTDLERSAAFVTKAKNPMKVVEWIAKDIPYIACRVPYDKKQELVEGNKNLAYYHDIIATMKMMRQMNPDIQFYATMKSDYHGYEHINNLPEWICDYAPTTYFHIDKYILFLVDYLQLMHDNDIAISYMTVSKEWGAVITPQRSIDIIDGLTFELEKRGIPVPKFTDPSAWAVNQAAKFVNEIVELNGQDRFYAFSTHNYNKSRVYYPDFIEACQAVSTPAWNDESGYGSGGRTYGQEPETLASILGAYETRAQYYNQGLEGELFFEICSRGVNSETRAIYFTKGSKAYRMRSYYVGKLFAENIYQRYLVPTSIDTMNDEISTMAFVNEDELCLWIVNNGSTYFPSIELDVLDIKALGNMRHHVFTIDTNIQGKTKKVKLKNDKYTLDVLPNSINFIKLKL